MMARLQHRRLKAAAIAVALVITYALWQRHRATTVTWADLPGRPANPHSISSESDDHDAGVTFPQSSISTPKVELTVTPNASPGDAQKSDQSLLLDKSQAGPEIPVSPASPPPKSCVGYEQLQGLNQEPLSTGKRKFPYSRPDPECRTFSLPSMEALIERMRNVIKDPDLFRLFENSYPNTLDTCIKWRGFANSTDKDTGITTITDEELAFVITGDIDAMWLRDSASQIYSYLPLLEASTNPDSLASLWRGMINSHARYIIISPYCHSFQPPAESNIHPTHNGAYHNNKPIPPYDPSLVFDCKWELDSLASFLQISVAYWQRTGDLAFFQKYKWVEAVESAIKAAGAMRLGTYSKEGKVEKSAWSFTGYTNRGSETLTNDGLGNPTKENGMVRTAFRPSDDACIYQLLVPANMMWATYLEEASVLMGKLEAPKAKALSTEMIDFASGIRKGIIENAIVKHKKFGDIFAYEIDGYGGTNLMDDANIPSLLALPLWNFSLAVASYPAIYSNTRSFALSPFNPYFMHGPVISAVGGPHLGPGKGWPMAAIVRALTAFSLPQPSKLEIQKEVREQIRMVLDSTDGKGVVHESVNSWKEKDWTRAWFGWANGLFGELMLKVEKESPELLKEDWQKDLPKNSAAKSDLSKGT